MMKVSCLICFIFGFSETKVKIVVVIAGDILVEKNKKPEADTSTGDSCFLRASVTPSSLIDDRLVTTNSLFLTFYFVT